MSKRHLEIEQRCKASVSYWLDEAVLSIHCMHAPKHAHQITKKYIKFLPEETEQPLLPALLTFCGVSDV